MILKIIETESGKVAVANSEEPIIIDGQSALEFVMNIGYEHNCRRIAVNKAAVAEDFFRLSTGLAGEIAQKFVNYRYRFAIVGDFSGYTSKPLRDFIYESNQGRFLYFAANEEEAIKRLSC